MLNKIILASKSKVRKEILDKNQIPNEVKPSNVDEDFVKKSLIREKAKPEIISKNLAELKANKISINERDRLVLGADSVIDLNGELISKPESREEALKILKKVGEQFNIPTITDIHTAEEAAIAAQYVDVIQIPAFLCRQTDILVAAAKTGKTVNIKKGQFLSPESMIHAVNKVKESGNNSVMITDRGTIFGYQDMVVDFRGIPTMKKFGVPVVLDITHSLQQPNQNSGVTGGKPERIETIAKAGIASGVDYS